MKNTLQETLKLHSNSAHPVFIGSGIIAEIPTFISTHLSPRKIVIITNTNLISLFATPLKDALEKENIECHIFDIPPGETQKTLQNVTSILNQLLSLKLERNDCIIALGGGVIGDMAGFIASIYLRGIPLIQIPTTLLAQVDASIGGKTGVNHPKGKNLIGTFYQSEAIFIDTDTLNSLPKKELRAGLAEIAKYAITLNPPLFEYMTQQASEIIKFSPASNPALWTHLIHESVKDKIAIVSQDEKEGGKRAILNFGHTVGHGIEAATQFKLFLHGEAVAIGMTIETKIAEKLALISKEDSEKIIQFLHLLSFINVPIPCTCEAIIEKMQMDKKIKSGKLRYVLPTKIGATTLCDTVKVEDVTEMISEFIK